MSIHVAFKLVQFHSMHTNESTCEQWKESFFFKLKIDFQAKSKHGSMTNLYENLGTLLEMQKIEEWLKSHFQAKSKLPWQPHMKTPENPCFIQKSHFLSSFQ